MVNIITPNSPATFNQRVAMSAEQAKMPLTPATPVTSSPMSSNPKKPNNSKIKYILATLGLVAFVGLASLAVLISSRQRAVPGPVAPNAPESKPQAYIEKIETCSLTFEVPVVCNSICLQQSDCEAVDPAWDCLSVDEEAEDSEKRCRLVSNPTAETCTPVGVTPTITPTPTVTVTVTITPTVTPTGVQPTLTITPTGVQPTPTEANEPTPTTPPGVTVNPTTPGTQTTYTVVTTVNCNDSCANNSDCSNISHICYDGKCRLDVNPEDARCALPSGETAVIVNVVPTRAPAPTELVKAGPADWGNYLKVGFGALGIGALLLLFL